MTTMVRPVTIREFQAGDQAAFERINAEWITRHFVLEPKDLSALSDPEGTIIDRGGRVFLAVEHGIEGEQVLGCCALAVMSPDVYEVAKMGVARAAQGHGIGRMLLTHVVAEARKSSATRLYLETNHALLPAIHLYRSLGFRPVPTGRVVKSPYTRADVYMELFF